MPDYRALPEKKSFLASIPLFRTLNDEQLERLAQMTQVADYAPGRYVCQEGEIGESLFLILDGSVSLEKDGVELGTYRRYGDCVGEMTLLDEQPRSASLRAATNVRILQLDRDQFEIMLSEYPEAGRELFKVLSSRLRESLNIQIDAIRRDAAFDQEIKLAAEVQQSLLPKKEMEFDGIETAGYCKPAHTVGGDYYDYLTLGSNRLGLVITDVMGHGFHSAMFAAMVRSCLQTQVIHAASVNAVMNSIRQSIDRLDTSLYLSICYLLVNTTSRTFSYANAGHPFPLHYRLHHDRLEKLESTCVPVGLFPSLPGSSPICPAAPMGSR